MTFKDLFSNHAAEYAAARPDYPPALFSYLATLTSSHELAWDCGTGNGQAAVLLARYFTRIIATDPSAQQIKSATHKKNIDYRVMPAEKTNLAEHSVDLITVAQAAHWFDLSKFYEEIRRVLKPDGVLAIWCYSRDAVTPAVDVISKRLYNDITGAYWAAERKYVDAEYKTLLFPFHPLITPKFHIEKDWNLAQLLAYMNTASGVNTFKKQTGKNPIDLILSDLEKAWGNAEMKRKITWPIHLLVGKLND